MTSILVTGATGKQGRAVLDALLETQPSPPTKIFALTRNASSGSAQALAAKPNVSLVEGDLDDPAAIFARTGTVQAVFSVQPALGGGATPEREEMQGKALVDAAVAAKVQHFVYTSVDRGGTAKSDNDPTDVPHFRSKYNIEKHLLGGAAAARPRPMTWTILRPTSFFEGLTPDFMGKVFSATWMSMGDHKLHFVSTRDIGRLAALALRNPGDFAGQAISMAGDYLTHAEARAVFRREMGFELPTTFGFFGSLLRWGVRDMGLMFTWLEDVGFAVDIPALKKRLPELQDFGTWLRQSSGFVAR